MEAINAPLLASEQFKKIEKDIDNNNLPVLVTGCFGSSRSHYINLLGRNQQYKLIITYNDQRAKELYEDYKAFDRDVYIYPAKDVLFYSADIHGNAIVRQRLEILRRIIENKNTTIILTIDAAMDRLVPIEEIKKNIYEIKTTSTIDIKELRGRLVELGYEKTDWVDGEGQFAIRGGIIDIFPLTEECPYRIELWGDEVDSIRSFDVDSQRSIENVQWLTIYPASEMILSQDRIENGIKKIEKEHKAYASKLKKEFKTEQYSRINKSIESLKEELVEFNAAIGIDSYINFFYENVVSFMDYFKNDVYVYIDEINRIMEKASAYETEFRESMISRLEGGYVLPSQTDVLLGIEEILGKISNKKVILFSELIRSTEYFTPKNIYEIKVKGVKNYNNSFDELIKEINKWKSKKYKIVLMSHSSTRAKRLAEDIRREQIECFYSDDKERILEDREFMVTTGRLKQGFDLMEIGLAVICENDIFTNKDKRKNLRKSAKYSGEKISSFADIAVGDYVVHERHGLGIYRGIEKIESDKVTKDYISIEYSGGSNLFILASQLDLIQKYAGSEAKKPKLNKLGGSEWEKTKSKVKGQIKDIANELVQLYAVRQSKEGYAYSEDTIWQREFEEMFPYNETDDQLKAIDDTKSDMESKKIMDRLICGDVGYGKTEVAIRAAFKAVSDSKQVVYLVPTTILAQQHYKSFSERMKDFPITVRMLSRFCSSKEQKITMEMIKKGQVDIVIGTHRLLSKDIVYKNLGLLIVDEEQRFGVGHKEKIKQLKKDVDVLTLSATPIPRTLHMSLIGIRDMSVLEEPPVDRRAIQTYVLEYNKELIKEAVNRELARGGQVYYVYNRVNNIDEITNSLIEILPEARISFAHGQMKERELEKIMLQFINGEIDVLVATTIIETGLDIPNVNTMIIHDANNFGLSQLYQLRGRVGRSNKSAYAFLMYKRDTMLKETAEKRLAAIREFTDLGSGFKIAMRDLEIRGAGNLLGADQSGHMAAVGYDLYCKMLNDEVKRLKGEIVEEDFDTTVDILIDAFIPASYVKNEFTKLELYKKIAQIENKDDFEDMLDEITDRFGEPPAAAINLLNVSLLKSKAHKAYILEITQKQEQVKIVMFKDAKVDVNKIDEFLKSHKNKIKLSSGEAPYFMFNTKDILKKNIIEEIQGIIDEIEAMLIK